MTAGGITIGIPTYRRATDCARLIAQIRLSPEMAGLPVLVVNDSGAEHDGAYSAAFASHGLDPNADFTYLAHPQNKGYPQALIALIESCTTDYLLVMADDDHMMAEGLPPLTTLIAAQSPALISPQWMARGKVARGMQKTRAVGLTEYLAASAHAPGLVYDVAAARLALPFLRDRLAAACAMALTYPQVLICVWLLLKQRPVWFLAAPVAAEGAALPAGITDGTGALYFTYPSRLRQAADFDAALALLPETAARDRLRHHARVEGVKKAFKADAALRLPLLAYLLREALLMPLRAASKALKARRKARRSRGA